MPDKPRPPQPPRDNRINNGYGKIEEGRIQKGGSNNNPSQHFESRPSVPTGSNGSKETANKEK